MNREPSSPHPDHEAPFERDLLAVKKRLHREEEKIAKWVEQRKATLEEALNWKTLHHEGLLIQANLFKVKKGMDRVEVLDWNLDANAPMRFIPLDPKLSPAEQIEWRFRKSGKLEAAIPHAQRMLEKAENALTVHLQKKAELEACTTAEALQAFCEKYHLLFKKQPLPRVKPKTPPPKIPYKTFKTESGHSILAGKSAKDNDLLTFHHANGSDWWLHAHNCSGSHVVIKLDKGEEPDPETLKDAAEIALRMSQLKQSGELTFTQVKWIRPLKAPGKVMVSHHKVFYHALDNKRWDRLRHSHPTSG